jgi:MYXO-CTERM domain-containing protein
VTCAARARSLTAPFAAVLFLSCLPPEGSPPAGSQPQQSAAPRAAVPPQPHLPFATIVGEKPLLPRYETEWEVEAKRRASIAGALHSGLRAADIFDDYRNTHLDAFYITKPPQTAGFRTPAEYEPSQAYIIHWNTSSDPKWNALYGGIVKNAWGVVPVLMIYLGASHKTWIESQITALGIPAAELSDPTKIIWWQHDLDAYWTRDYGPVSIVGPSATGPGPLSFVDLRYYHARPHDDIVPSDLAKAWGINSFRADLEYEGGNFQTTSDGLCSATKGVLYANLQYSQSAVEQLFKSYLGCKKVVFAATMQGGVIAHIDMFSKMASDTTIIIGEYTAAQDATNKAILDANAALFAATTNGSGQPITVLRIPMPGHKVLFGLLNVWRSYTNSLALNGGAKKVMLIPVYEEEPTYEAAAMQVYAAAFPGWTLVKIASDVIIPQQGAIHCITMQIPTGTHAKMEVDPLDACGQQKLVCTPEVCGKISSFGCCSGAVLKYCNKGVLKHTDCAGTPQCGWDAAKSYYNCNTPGGVDPSGVHPRSCDAVTDAAVGDGAGCGAIPAQGCCDGETLRACEGGAIKALDCSGNLACGWSPIVAGYQCGTTGGADPSGKLPKACAAYSDGGVRDTQIAIDRSPPDGPPSDQPRAEARPPDRASSEQRVDGQLVVSGGGGCSCGVAGGGGGSSSTFAWAALLLVGLLGRRRR